MVDAEKAALLFKALGDENRIRILEMLCSGEKCACRLLEELNITQPTLSHHMKLLCETGLVHARKEGKWTHYSILREGGAAARQLVQTLTASGEDPRTEG